jgi:hypothetical protein
MRRVIPLGVVCACVAASACDVGPKFDFDFGPRCTLNCPCRLDSDCSKSPCHRPICNGGTCTSVAEPDGVSDDNRKGDCAQIACAAGKSVYTFDSEDFPAPRECRIFSCQPGRTSSDRPEVIADPLTDGTPCASFADGSGRCHDGECTRPVDAGSDASLDAPSDG